MRLIVPLFPNPGITTVLHFWQEYPDSRKPLKDTRMVNDYERNSGIDRFYPFHCWVLKKKAGFLDPALYQFLIRNRGIRRPGPGLLTNSETGERAAPLLEGGRRTL